MNIFKNGVRGGTEVVRLLFRRVWHIAGYALALFVLINIAERAFYHFGPASFFVRDYRIEVQNGIEHTNVPMQACREHRGDYPAKITRNVYQVLDVAPDNSGREVFVGSFELEKQITTPHCENMFIAVGQFDHSPGNYSISSTLCFRVKYNEEKCLTTKSNIYTIFAATPDDIQKRIDELEKEIQRLRELQEQLGRGNTDGSFRSNTTRDTSGGGSTTTTTTRTPGGNGGSGGTGGSGGSGGNGGTPDPDPEPPVDDDPPLVNSVQEATDDVPVVGPVTCFLLQCD